MTTDSPAVVGNVVAQGDSDSIGCRIVVDGVVKAERDFERSERVYLLPGQGRMSSQHTSHEHTATIRCANGPSVCGAHHLGWLAITVIVTVGVPSLEQVAKEHAVSLSPKDAPSVKAMKRIGEVFKESNSDSLAMIVLEGEQPLGDDAHQYYDNLIRQLKADPKHVQHVQDFWGDPLTAPGAQSADGKAAYVQLNLAGNQGEALANESVEAVRNIVQRTPAPDGVKAYVTGPAALAADMNNSGDSTVLKITVVTIAVIFMMLLLVYRSIIDRDSAVGSWSGSNWRRPGESSRFSAITDHRTFDFCHQYAGSLGIAAGTDYGIFFVGRYQEARQAGEDRETAYYTTYRGVAHVVLASGLTIAGATFLPQLHPAADLPDHGRPVRGGHARRGRGRADAGSGGHGRRQPLRTARAQAHDVGSWLAAGRHGDRALARAHFCRDVRGRAGRPAGTAGIPGQLQRPDIYRRTSPPISDWRPRSDISPQARMMPEVLMIESDHDMRNPADFLVLNKLAKGIFGVPGISRVQGVTRPEGTPIEHTSIPFLLSMQNAGQLQNMKFHERPDGGHAQAGRRAAGTIATLERMYALMQQLADTTHHMVGVTQGNGRRSPRNCETDIADFDDFLRPIRNYFYWEKHCYDIPICWALRSAY